MSVELKPCPFCGGKDIRIDEHHGAGRGPLHYGESVYSMGCYHCGATFPNRYRRDLLSEAWNCRAPDVARAPEDIQEAREILENMVVNIESGGNYSENTTLCLIRQALQCLSIDRANADGEKSCAIQEFE